MKHLKSKKSNLAEFLNGRGFYVVLLVCIAAVGVSAYVLFFTGGSDGMDQLAIPKYSVAPPTASTQPTDQPLQTEIPGGARNKTEVVMSSHEPAAPMVDDTRPASNEADDTEVGEPLGVAAEVAGDAELTGMRPEGPAAAFYVWPLNGEVTAAFSIDELVFSNTMEDWRVHTGADIAASLGASVKAIGDGVIEDVYNDDMMGTTVLINHNNGTRSVYRSLMEAVDVAVGDAVYAGTVIGTVGRTADAELAEPPHLHLEVIRDGAQIDPLSILP